ncbi:MAG: hypothetical protein ACRELY_24605 [Polyangiaceae bacterium]
MRLLPASTAAVTAFLAAAIVHCNEARPPAIASLPPALDASEPASTNDAALFLAPSGPAPQRMVAPQTSPTVLDLRDLPPVDAGYFESLAADPSLYDPTYPEKALERCLKQPEDAEWSARAVKAMRADIDFIAAHHMTGTFKVTRALCRTSCCVASVRWDQVAEAGAKALDHVTNCVARARVLRKNGDEDLVKDCAGARTIHAPVKADLVDRGTRPNGGVWAFEPWDGSDGGIFPLRL